MSVSMEQKQESYPVQRQNICSSFYHLLNSITRNLYFIHFFHYVLSSYEGDHENALETSQQVSGPLFRDLRAKGRKFRDQQVRKKITKDLSS